jgi:exosortase E/protease (VPEID-CTERM system)
VSIGTARISSVSRASDVGPALLTGLIALFVAEVLFITQQYDTEVLESIDRWPAKVVLAAPQAGQLSVWIVAATLLIGGWSFWKNVAFSKDSAAALSTWPWFLVLHVASWGAFYALTDAILGRHALHSASQWTSSVIGAAWLLSGVMTLLSWMAMLIPPARWATIVQLAGRPLALGIAVGVTAWAAGRGAQSLWHPLASGTFWLVRALLNAAGFATVARPDDLIIGTSNFSVSIAPACSGYEGMGLAFVFTSAYLALFREHLRFPRAFALIPLAMAVMWIANAARIAALIAIGDQWSPELALGGFHSQAGSLLFAGVGLAVVAASQRTSIFSTAPVSSRTTIAAAPWLMPLCVLLLTMMLTRALTNGFDALYPLRVVAVGAVLWYYRGRYGAPLFSWNSVAFCTGIAVFILWIATDYSAPTSAEGTGLTSLSSTAAAAWLIFRVVGSVITVPIAEELAFRGFLMRRLVAADFQTVPFQRFAWPAFLISSVLFGALHGRWFAGTLAGMAYALVLYRRGRIGDAVLAHATTNALLAAYVLTTGNWSTWQ